MKTRKVLKIKKKPTKKFVAVKEVRKISKAGARKKGHDFEREVAIALREIFPGAKRHLEYQSDEAKIGVDVEIPGYRFQCKRGRKYASMSAIREVQVCPIEAHVPILVTRGDNTEALAALPFSHLVVLLKTYLKSKD